MESTDEEIHFPFPFPPYEIQRQFMRALYVALRDKKLGIFESPTGTGKSLSMCCGALKWLKDHEEGEFQTLEKDIAILRSEIENMPDTEDWLSSEYNKIKRVQDMNVLIAKLNKIKERMRYFEEMRTRVNKVKKNINIKTNPAFDATFNRNSVKKNESKEGNGIDIVEEVNNDDQDLIIDELEEKEDIEKKEEEDIEEESSGVKIFISSRTHSQLSQLVGEIKRTEFAASARVVTLASRQHYCINPEVNRLKNLQLINERCLDMQKSKTKSTSTGDDGKVLKKTKCKGCTGCPYYNQTSIGRLKERSLMELMDMEDFVRSGRELKACPYYAARAAVADAQVVLVSHAGVVSAGARSGVSLRLANNVLLVDEAHGLASALESAHAAPLPARPLAAAARHLRRYVRTYRSRLASRGLLAINQLLFVMDRLLGMIEKKSKEEMKMSEETRIFTVEQFTLAAEIDHLNLRHLVDFCRDTRLPQKLHGFSMRYNSQVDEEEVKPNKNSKSSLESFLSTISKKTAAEKAVEDTKTSNAETNQQLQGEGSAGSGLYAVLWFLTMLCERSSDGRVLALPSTQLAGQLKYLLLNPAAQFAEPVRQCRSVILAGGTMEPISEFRALLTEAGGVGSGGGDAERLSVLRCDHVVSPERVLAACLSRGPAGVPLNFTYHNRQSKELLDEVCGTLRNVAGVVPGGVVCFLPSYAYEQTLYEHLQATRLLELIGRKKALFREPKSAAQVDQVLSDYASAVRRPEGGRTGALLLSVVGGKLSEGLNFSDELGRCVLVVGMPYPSIKSPELQEKMTYLNRTVGAGAGNTYYENLCMKAVNQCIGRAVRHANDYACVLLLDERYSRAGTAAALPGFVQKSLQTNLSFGAAFGSIAKFFAKHKREKPSNSL